MNTGQGGRSLAPIFAKKKPRLALLAHPNNSQSVNDHIPQPQGKGIKRQHQASQAFHVDGPGSYPNQQYAAQATTSMASMFPEGQGHGQPSASYSSSSMQNMNSSFGMSRQPTGYNGPYQARGGMMTSGEGLQNFPSNMMVGNNEQNFGMRSFTSGAVGPNYNPDQGMQNFTPGGQNTSNAQNTGFRSTGPNVASSFGKQSFTQPAGQNTVHQQQMRDYSNIQSMQQMHQPNDSMKGMLYTNQPSTALSNQPRRESFTSHQSTASGYMATNTHGSSMSAGHSQMQTSNPSHSFASGMQASYAQSQPQTWNAVNQLNMGAGNHMTGGVPVAQMPQYGQPAWGNPAAPFNSMQPQQRQQHQQQQPNSNHFNSAYNAHNWNATNVANSRTTSNESKMMDSAVSQDIPVPSSSVNRTQNDVKIQTKNAGSAKSLRMITATVQGMKHWSQYRNKIPLLFEVFGQLTSAVTVGATRMTKEFVIKDDKQSVPCIFHEIDRILPQVIRGQWYRCVGSLESNSKKFRCVSIRRASDTEIKMHKVFVTASDRTMRSAVAKTREL